MQAMNYYVKSSNPEKQRVGCVIVGVNDRRKLTEAAATLDQAAGGAIGTALRRGDLDGKAGQTLVLHHVPKIYGDRILLVGLGRERDFNEAAYRKACQAAARAVRTTGAIDAVSYLTHLPVKGRGIDWSVRQAVLAAQDEYYRLDAFRGEKPREDRAQNRLGRLTFDVPRRSDLPAAEAGLREGLAIGGGVTLAKNLGNTPPNVCTPTYLAEQALALAKQHGAIKVKVLGRDDMEKLGMGALLAVAQGSRQPPKLIVLEYWHGAKGEKPVALVGKGITFDSGGISIKPSDKMDEMKFDMCGGAAVLGTFKAVAELKLPVNLVGVVPTCENMPGGLAVKPGDIVRSMAGITIEILNTDAEGRLILCDARLLHRHRDPHRRDRRRARRLPQRPVQQHRAAGARAARCRRGNRRPRLANAAVGRIRGPAQERTRRHRQYFRWPRRRRDHRGELPAPFRAQDEVGPPRHRRDRVEGQARDRPAGAAADPVPAGLQPQAGRDRMTGSRSIRRMP
jgi:leucyl aminopeptidase